MKSRPVTYLVMAAIYLVLALAWLIWLKKPLIAALWLAAALLEGILALVARRKEKRG